MEWVETYRGINIYKEPETGAFICKGISEKWDIQDIKYLIDDRARASNEIAKEYWSKLIPMADCWKTLRGNCGVCIDFCKHKKRCREAWKNHYKSLQEADFNGSCVSTPKIFS